VGANTVTAVEEFWTAARSDPLTAAMAATSVVRLAEVATERMVEAGAGLGDTGAGLGDTGAGLGDTVTGLSVSPSTGAG
jgi:hypothetical protein